MSSYKTLLKELGINENTLNNFSKIERELSKIINDINSSNKVITGQVNGVEKYNYKKLYNEIKSTGIDPNIFVDDLITSHQDQISSYEESSIGYDIGDDIRTALRFARQFSYFSSVIPTDTEMSEKMKNSPVDKIMIVYQAAIDWLEWIYKYQDDFKVGDDSILERTGGLMVLSNFISSIENLET